jgi:hypothetical protein
VALAQVPAVVGTGLAEVDLLPRVLPDVVDEEARAGVVRVERHPERIAQTGCIRLAALAAGRGATGDPTAVAVGAQERIVGRHRTVGPDAQDLAGQHVRVASGVVVSGAARGVGVVAAAVADADVEMAITAEVQVARVVVAVGRRHVVDQHELGCGIDDAVRAERETRHAIDRALRDVVGADAVLAERVVEIDEAIVGEAGIDGHAEQTALRVRAGAGAERERSRGEQRAVLHHA